MWTQIGKTELVSAASAGDTVVSLSASNNVQVGDWIVIEPFSSNCEIRKVIDFAPPNKYTLNKKLLSISGHSNHTEVFVQTSPNWDILLFGAQPDPSFHYNAIAIQNAGYDCAFNGGGIVSIPKGSYLIYHNANTSGSIIHCEPDTDHPTFENVKYIGEGQRVSIILHHDLHNTDRPIFTLNKTNGIEFHDMTILGLTSEADEHAHVFGVNKSASMKFLNLEMGIVGGDCIQLVDETNGYRTHDILVDNCYMHGTGRSGVQVQHDVKDVIITNNRFENMVDADIDMEPTSGNTPRNITISKNFFQKSAPHNGDAIQLNGSHNPNLDTNNFIVSDNIINNGSINIATCYSVIISNNIINGGIKRPILFAGRNENIIINNNLLANNSLYDSAIYGAGSNRHTILDLTLNGNEIINGSIEFQNCHDIKITNNSIRQKVTEAHGIVMSLSLDPNYFNLPNYGNIIITGNEITQEQGLSPASFTGILLTAQYADTYPWPPSPPGPPPPPMTPTYNLIEIDNNNISSAVLAYGIRINHPGNNTSLPIEYWNQLLIGKGNRVGATTPSSNPSILVFDGVSRVFSYQMAQNPIASQWIANGSPEGLVSGQQGTTAIDKTREADNKYQLNTIDGNTGWTLLSEMGKQVLFEDDFQDIRPLAISPFYIDDTTKHLPNINVIGNPWYTQTAFFKQWAIYNTITPHKAYAPNTSLNALAVVDVKANIEIKALFKTDLSSGSYFGGIVFRVDTSSANSFWRFQLRKSSSTLVIELFEPMGTVSLISSSFTPTLGSGYFELKVVIKNDFISVFYNDLILLSLYSILNNSFMFHGIITNTYVVSKISCYNFKILNN